MEIISTSSNQQFLHRSLEFTELTDDGYREHQNLEEESRYCLWKWMAKWSVRLGSGLARCEPAEEQHRDIRREVS
ncbi:hypothetical protein ElyMa_000144000 [Elysia marginata]|uniref:Uncharacterized protein n=1 Tax=Elysia marginata TaxID=1093978 RepID=A0AAV4EQ36_9GAST|nr:hypothetical protein ElyMa_000144000 [Elysia marginata]